MSTRRPPSHWRSATVTDYSEIAFVPADSDDQGNIITPRRPRLFTYSGRSEYLVVRYTVKPPDTSKPYDENNPFVLMRQEGCTAGTVRWAGTCSAASTLPTGSSMPGGHQRELA